MLRVGWLDLKLAARLLVRYPGLTIAGGLAMLIGIPVSLAPIQLALAVNTPLPFREGYRIVALEHLDVSRANHARPTVHDFGRWQRTLTSFDSFAAERRRVENIVGDEGLTDVVRGAEMSASAFRVIEVEPLLGRAFDANDELAGATPVVILGYDLWHKYFQGDPRALGRALRFGRTRRVVVGVMPAGFQFPSRESYWLPLQVRPSEHPIGTGPRFLVFGRLRDGVTRDQAQAELRASDGRMPADHPATYQNLRPEVRPYSHVATGLSADFKRSSPMFLMSLLLLGVVCGNVGTLMLARAATRSNEIAVRTALGAGRARIVTQLFVEMLLLTGLAATAGLILADLAVTYVIPAHLMARMPFWFDLHIKPTTVAIAAGLVVFSAVVAGLLPALKATRGNAFDTLKRQGAGSGVSFGRIATALIVLEVAIGVAGLTGVGSVARGAFRNPSLGATIPAHEFLTTELRLPAEAAAESARLSGTDWSTRWKAIHSAVARLLAAEPGVRVVTFANVLPGMDHGGAVIELERDAGGGVSHRVKAAFVEPGFFRALAQTPIVGRAFELRDLKPRGRDVVVNRRFVEQVFDGQSPVGHRLRTVAGPNQPAGPWREILGVVNDLGMNVVNPAKGAGVYFVVGQGELHPMQLVVRLGGDPAAFVPRLRGMLNDIEPGIVLDNPTRLDEVFSQTLWEARFGSLAFALFAVTGVMLSAAGLYALMAFSVTRRTREIAIRTALGAGRVNLVRTVVTRALLQLTAGAILGAGLGAALVPEILNEHTNAGNWRQMLAAVATTMVVVGLAACAVPARRALRIQPVEALKEVG